MLDHSCIDPGMAPAQWFSQNLAARVWPKGFVIARILFRNINPALRYHQRLPPRHGQCAYFSVLDIPIVLLLYSLLLPHTLFIQNTCKKHLIVCILSALKPYSFLPENNKWIIIKLSVHFFQISFFTITPKWTTVLNLGC